MKFTSIAFYTALHKEGSDPTNTHRLIECSEYVELCEL